MGGGSQITQGLGGHSKDLGFTLNEMGNHCRVWSSRTMNDCSRRTTLAAVETQTKGQGQERGNQLEATAITQVRD